jgi:thymidylate synthase
MSKADLTYIKLVEDILNSGIQVMDRTGTGTIGLTCTRAVYDLKEEFPILTTKKMFFKGAVRELLWFFKGTSNINDMHPSIHKWWQPWADESGLIKGSYPTQWRDFNNQGIDQIAWLVNEIKTNPNSRRLVLSNWNPIEVLKTGTKLPSCLPLCQFFVRNGLLSCQLYQRSADTLLGLPIDVVDYALLTHILAQLCELKVDTLTHVIGDQHIYLNHLDVIKEQISRVPYKGPTLEIKPFSSIEELTEEHFILHGYESHPAIKGAMSV